MGSNITQEKYGSRQRMFSEGHVLNKVMSLIMIRNKRAKRGQVWGTLLKPCIHLQNGHQVFS